MLLRRVNLVVDACVITQRRSRRHSNIVFDVCSRAASKKLQQNCRYGHTVHFVQRTHCHFKQIVKCTQTCTLHARLAMGGKFILLGHEYTVSFPSQMTRRRQCGYKEIRSPQKSPRVTCANWVIGGAGCMHVMSVKLLWILQCIHAISSGSK